jgi:hypothetical protein
MNGESLGAEQLTPWRQDYPQSPLQEERWIDLDRELGDQLSHLLQMPPTAAPSKRWLPSNVVGLQVRSGNSTSPGPATASSFSKSTFPTVSHWRSAVPSFRQSPRSACRQDQSHRIKFVEPSFLSNRSSEQKS